ncbi:hypothetical protein VNO78_14710 [Psophocarpus tetragonolobus]|uniref:Uncharacterized protein n=1 Tax=Psophocarpus tetragonolobus TaxID=3891 RepID=A0AAN9SEK8_PSOTE
MTWKEVVDVHICVIDGKVDATSYLALKIGQLGLSLKKTRLQREHIIEQHFWDESELQSTRIANARPFEAKIFQLGPLRSSLHVKDKHDELTLFLRTRNREKERNDLMLQAVKDFDVASLSLIQEIDWS